MVKQGSQVTAATAATLSSITAKSLKQAVQAAVQVALVPTQQAFAALQGEVSSMREILEAHAKTQVLHAHILANLTQSFPPSQQPPNARPPPLAAPRQPMSNHLTFQEPPPPPFLPTLGGFLRHQLLQSRFHRQHQPHQVLAADQLQHLPAPPCG